MRNPTIPATAEGMPKTKILSFPTDASTREQREGVLTDALDDAERMASILCTLLLERIRDTGKRAYLTVDRQDAEDIQFAGEQLASMLARAGEIWRKLP